MGFFNVASFTIPDGASAAGRSGPNSILGHRSLVAKPRRAKREGSSAGYQVHAAEHMSTRLGPSDTVLNNESEMTTGTRVVSL